MIFDDLPREIDRAVDRALERAPAAPALEEIGVVLSVGRGVATASGLPNAQYEELILLPEGGRALAFNLDREEIGLILLTRHETLGAGMEVRRSGRVLDIPVGDALVGRVIDAAGHPLDGRGPLRANERRPLEVEAPAIMDRAPVTEPLQTGIKVIDALIPIGRGQRELILGDRQTGKTTIALDAMINQRDRGVICIYCAVGQREASVARAIQTLKDHEADAYSIVIAASCEEAPGLQYAAPYAAASIGEYFMEKGNDVLVVFDDLTKHARSYRELSLLLRRPPGREAYPGDIFYVHSRLLERATHLRDDRGGGSMTALPIIETEAQNISAYIPTNLISITDGQIYVSPDLFSRGQLPAVDVGKSVSRVGGKAQRPAYRAVAGDLRLSYSQFEELERFARFGTRLDDDTRRTLNHGRRVREILKQNQHQLLTVAEQVTVLLAVSEGLFDEIELSRVAEQAGRVIDALNREHGEIAKRIDGGEKLSDEDRSALIDTARSAMESETPNHEEDAHAESAETQETD